MDRDQDIIYIEKVLAGDRNAYAILVDRYKDMVFSLALRMVRNREEAEEIAPAEVQWSKSEYCPSLDIPVNMKKKIYYVESYMADINHRFMAAGAEVAFKEMGWDYEILNPENDLQLQIKMIEDSIAQDDCDGLIIKPVDAGGVADLVQKITDSGLPVAIMDRCVSIPRRHAVLSAVPNHVEFSCRYTHCCESTVSIQMKSMP